MDWEFWVEDVSASDGLMKVIVKGQSVAIRFEAPYDERGLKFFKRLAEESLRIRIRLSFT